jgi:hypothetical protein
MALPLPAGLFIQFFMKQKKKVVTRNHYALQIAALWGVTPDYVRKVMRGDRRHAGILKSYRLLQQETNKLLRTIAQWAK